MTNPQDREAFEEEILATYSGEAAGFLDRDEDGFYIDYSCELQIHWQVFQAACAYKEKQMKERMTNLEADAARYQWLKSRIEGVDFSWGDPPSPVLVFSWPDHIRVGGSLDQNIDAALADKERGNHD